MNKAVIFGVVMVATFFCNINLYAGEYKEFNIRYGMHEKTISRLYGEPVLLQVIKRNPITRKKALYETGESSYMIINFFSGRVSKIVLLQDMELDEAKDVFNQPL